VDLKNFAVYNASNLRTIIWEELAFVGFLKQNWKKEKYFNACNVDAEDALLVIEYIYAKTAL
jgi:hypothetical protein